MTKIVKSSLLKGIPLKQMHKCDELSMNSQSNDTVLRMIILNRLPVPVQFRCGSDKLKLCRYFTIFYIKER